MNLWRIKITSYLISVIQSVFPSHTSRVAAAPPRRRSSPAASVARIPPGMPQALPATAHDPHGASQRRGSRQFPTYTRGHYLSHGRHQARRRQPIFRIG